LEEATFVCSEHAYRTQHFDDDDSNAVLLVNDTELVDTTDSVKDDAEATSDPNVLDVNLDPDNDDDPTNAQARTFKVQDHYYEKLRPLFGWMPI
jgi:hypothetical protein